ncbi:MAG: RluA family pseudouridine synthase [Eubacteriales bacterium]
MKKIRVDNDEDIGHRIDYYISNLMEEWSRTYIKTLIEKGHIFVNDLTCKPSYKLQPGDVVEIHLPSPRDLTIEPQEIDLDIRFEDDHVLVVNKPQGMVVHPASGNYKNTLVNALLFHIERLSSINGVMRPGIVHRIDKDTSGLLLVAKSNKAHQSLSEQLKEHTINRKYMALVEGIITEDNGTIDAPIGRDPHHRKKMMVIQRNSKNAITHFNVIKRFTHHTLIEAKLETGRTHQIRVHMNFIHHPVVGDDTYGYRKQDIYNKGQLLHAYFIGFIHPDTAKYMEFKVDLPDYFEDVLQELAKSPHNN